MYYYMKINIIIIIINFRQRKYGRNNPSHCHSVRLSMPLFQPDARFLDLTDLVIMDYLSYHMDTKFYHMIVEPFTTVHIDRGRA